MASAGCDRQPGSSQRLGTSYTSSVGRHGTRGLQDNPQGGPGGCELPEPATAGRTCPRAPGGSRAPQEAQLSSSAGGPGWGSALAPGSDVFIGMWSGASRKPSGRPALGKWIAN